MCMSKVLFNTTVDEDDELSGIGFKIFQNYNLESSIILDFNMGTFRYELNRWYGSNKQERQYNVGDVDYNVGFHIFSQPDDCYNYLRRMFEHEFFHRRNLQALDKFNIFRVKYRNILAVGLEQNNIACIAARYMKVLEKVEYDLKRD